MRVDLNQRRLVVGITGASGSILAERLIEECLPQFERIYILITKTGDAVLRHELSKAKEGFSLLRFLAGDHPKDLNEKLRVFDIDDFFPPIASGTSAASDMVVVPCSMGTLARIRQGISSNLLERTADVMIKERRRLILCVREAPLSPIHLENMLELARVGATILPPVPGFYQKPKELSDVIDFVVGRILEQLVVPHSLYKPWNSRLV